MVIVWADELDGRGLLVHVRKGTVIHHINFKAPVSFVSFSPDGKHIAVSHGSTIQVWHTPSFLNKDFTPFALHREYTGHHDEVLSITWSKTSRCVAAVTMASGSCSRYFISTSRDMTARLFTLNPLEGFKPKTFGGHRDIILGAYFSDDEKTVRGVTLTVTSADG